MEPERKPRAPFATVSRRSPSKTVVPTEIAPEFNFAPDDCVTWPSEGVCPSIETPDSESISMVAMKRRPMVVRVLRGKLTVSVGDKGEGCTSTLRKGMLAGSAQKFEGLYERAGWPFVRVVQVKGKRHCQAE